LRGGGEWRKRQNLIVRKSEKTLGAGWFRGHLQNKDYSRGRTIPGETLRYPPNLERKRKTARTGGRGPKCPKKGVAHVAKGENAPALKGETGLGKFVEGGQRILKTGGSFNGGACKKRGGGVNFEVPIRRFTAGGRDVAGCGRGEA